MSSLPFYLPETDNSFEQEAWYAYLKDIVAECTQDEVYKKRIFRLIYRQDGILVVAQVGEPCAVYKKPITAIFETPCTYVVVSKGYSYTPLVIRKDQVLEIISFDEQKPDINSSDLSNPV